MTRQEREYLLIVKQTVLQADDIKSLSSSLFWESGIDASLSAQAITGSSYAMLCKGGRNKIEKASAILEQSKILRWIIYDSRTLRFMPKRVTGLTVDQAEIHFITQTREIKIEKDDQILVFLADIHGDAVRKIKDEAFRNHGAETEKQIQPITRRFRYKTFLANKPLADIYVFSATGGFKGAARLSYINTGITADSKTVDASEKLHEILAKCRELSGRFILNMEFGFARISGSYPLPSGSSDEILENTERLTRMGNYFVIMDQEKPFQDMKKELAFLSESYAVITLPPPDPSETAAKELLAAAEKKQEQKPVTTVFDKKFWSKSEDLPPPPDEPSEKTNRTVWIIAAFIVFFFFMKAGADNERANFAARFADSFVTYGINTGLVFAAVSLILLLTGFRYISLKRLIENLPTSKIRSASMGMSELKGKAARKYNLVSPISFTPCVYYSIEKFRKNSKDSWTRYACDKRSAVPFYLEDETGRMLVSPEGALLYGVKKNEYHGMVMLTNTGTAIPIPAGEKWIEEIIPVDSPLYVLGWLSPVAKGDDTVKNRVLEKLRILKHNRSDLMRYDTDGDGKINDEEWDAARTDMEEEALKESLDHKNVSMVNNDTVMLAKPSSPGFPLIIAPTRMEDKITRRFFLIGVSCFTCSVVLAVTAIVYGLL